MHIQRLYYDDPYDDYLKKPFYEINRSYHQRKNQSIDWYIPERNQIWHQTYFAKQAVKDHQAKGNCRFAMLCMEYMEDQGWLQPNDIILDPMCGIGSFNMMAALRGYDSIGVELEKVYYDDMMGFERPEEDILIGAPTEGTHFNLFAGIDTHIEGSIEKFRKATAGIKGVGMIQIVQHDARDLLFKLSELKLLCDITNDSIHILNSPPYGNRLTDEMQKTGSNVGRKHRPDYKDTKFADRKQYSLDPANIGNSKLVLSDNSKINVLNSPPYTSGTEQNKDQAKYLDQTGHKEHIYDNPDNIARLEASAYAVEMLKVYKSIYSVLSSGSYVCLITRNFIQKGEIIYLDKLTKSLMRTTGFKYLTTKRAALPEVSCLKITNWNKFFKSRGLPLIDWEEATFYMKE